MYLYEICMTVYDMKYVITNIYDTGLKSSFWSFLNGKISTLTCKSFPTACGKNIIIYAEDDLLKCSVSIPCCFPQMAAAICSVMFCSKLSASQIFELDLSA